MGELNLVSKGKKKMATETQQNEYGSPVTRSGFIHTREKKQQREDFEREAGKGTETNEGVYRLLVPFLSKDKVVTLFAWRKGERKAPDWEANQRCQLLDGGTEERQAGK